MDGYALVVCVRLGNLNLIYNIGQENTRGRD